MRLCQQHVLRIVVQTPRAPDARSSSRVCRSTDRPQARSEKPNALLRSTFSETTVSSSSPARTPSSARKTLWLVVRVGITVCALGWLSTQVDLSRIAAILATVPRWVLITPFVALLGTAALHATRLTLLLQASAVKLRWNEVFSVVLRAAFVGAVSPRGGADIARVAWLSRAAGQVEPVLAAALVGRILDLVPWLLMLLWGIGSGVLSQNPPLLASASLFSTVFVVVLVATVVLGTFGRPLAERLPLFRARALMVTDAVQTLGRSPRLLALVAILGLGVGALNVWSVFVVATALGAHLPVAHAIGVVPAMDTVISLPVTISGVGLREGVFVVAFEPRGLDQDAAVAAAWTRWSGEIARALLGGALFAIGGPSRADPTMGYDAHPQNDSAPETDE